MAVVVGVDKMIGEFELFSSYAIASVWIGLPLSAVIPHMLSVAVVVCCSL